MSTYELEDNVELLRKQRDGWTETARQYARNADYYQDERNKLLYVIREMAKEDPKLVKKHFPDLDKWLEVLEFWEKDR